MTLSLVRNCADCELMWDVLEDGHSRLIRERVDRRLVRSRHNGDRVCEDCERQRSRGDIVATARPN